MPGMRITGRHQMGSPERETEVKMQELQVAVFSPEEGYLEIQPVSLVQEMGVRENDNRGNLKGERVQQPPTSPVVR